MSPTTRWSRKRTPFTTWPSRTSRQGMMRRARMVELLGSDALFEQGFAAHGSGDSAGSKRFEIGCIAYASRGLPGKPGEAALCFTIELDVGAGQGPVALDVRAQDVFDAALGIALDGIPERQRGALGPTSGADHGASGVDTDIQRQADPLAAEAGDPVGHFIGALNRCAAHDDPLDADAQQVVDGRC